MTILEVLDHLTADEREVFLSSPVDRPDVQGPFRRALDFDDKGAIRELRIALAHVGFDRDFARAIETLTIAKDESSVRGLLARRMLREYTANPLLPEEVDCFLRSYALVAACVLRDPNSRASERRRRLLADLLDEAAAIETKQKRKEAAQHEHLPA